MKKLLLILLLITSVSANAQFLKDIFKYSTLYGAYTQTDPIQDNQSFYVTQDNELIETTERNPSDFMVTYGWRKIAFFQYENREKFVTQTNNVGTKSNIGNINKGLEWLVEYSKGRRTGDEFENHQAFVRYLGKYYLLKAEYLQNEILDLNYISGEARFRLPIGKKLSLSVGAIYRTYDKAYGHNPIQLYLQGNEDVPGQMWWTLAYDYAGHTDQLYEMIDPFTGQSLGYDYQWFNANGELLAASDADYRNSIFEDVVNQYNEEQLDLIGGFADVSAIIGLDFYHYRKNFWAHIYGNVLPLHKLVEGDERYSYGTYNGSDDWIDYQYGGVVGFKITKNIGVFTEVQIQKFWDRKLEAIKAGINIKL